MPLSEFAVRKAKSRDKSFKLSDGGGLFLQIQPNGSKLWRLKFRFGGKEKLLSFGAYPLLSISAARIKRDEAKKLLGAGIDPSLQKKLDKISADAARRNTFGLVAEEYIDRLVDNELAESTIKKNRWLLMDIAAPLTNRVIDEVSSAEVLNLLQVIEKSGRRETARKLRGAISGVFRLAIITSRAKNDPTQALRGALLSPKRIGRPAIVDEKQFGAFLCAVDEYTGWETVTAAIQFQILTCVRPGEARGAMKSEFDLDKGIWHIPAERMKMRRPHDVPLSRQALAVLERILPLTNTSHLIFPSLRSDQQQLSENAFNSALRRLGYTKDEVTAHGFRVTASTILNSRGYEADVIEAVLAHQDPNTIRRTYNRATYWDQRVELMQGWADLLDELRILTVK